MDQIHLLSSNTTPTVSAWYNIIILYRCLTSLSWTSDAFCFGLTIIYYEWYIKKCFLTLMTDIYLLWLLFVLRIPSPFTWSNQFNCWTVINLFSTMWFSKIRENDCKTNLLLLFALLLSLYHINCSCIDGVHVVIISHQINRTFLLAIYIFMFWIHV